MEDLGAIKGFCQVEKNQKIREKLGLVRPTHPLHYQMFFFNNWKHENNSQKNEKTQISKEKLNPSWGLTHPSTFEFFSDFWIFLTLQNP